MVIEDWAPTLFRWLRDSGDWISYDDPHVVISIGKLGSQEESAFLSLVYNERSGELFFRWDPQLRIPSNVRTLYEQMIDSLNNYIDEFESGFGQFVIDEADHILFFVSLKPEFEELYPTAIEDINTFADEIYAMCGNMYPAILEAESGKNIDEIVRLACARDCSHAGHA